MAAIVLDLEAFPLIVSRFPERWDESELQTYFDAFVAVHDREKPFVHISDISQAENMSKAGMRKKAADFMVTERARSARLCRGSVQVASSTLLRGAITAIQWITPPPYPHAVVGTWDEAVAWVMERAKTEGMRVSDPRRPAPLPRL